MKQIEEFVHRIVKNKDITGLYIKKYLVLYLILLCVIAIFEVVMFIRGFILFDFQEVRHYCYMVCYVILFVISAFIVGFLIQVKKKGCSDKALSILMNSFSTFFILWAAFISVMDIMGGHYPIVYLTIIVTLGGVVVLDPILFSVSVLVTSVGMTIAGNFLNVTEVFTNGDAFNLFVFVVMALFVAYRNYITCVREEKFTEHLEELTFKDTLTGLGNETAYFKLVDQISEELKQHDFPFAVLVMDVNGLKNTDDTFGHRFGSHLIATAGEMLKSIFAKDDCFHVGGDEFVIIVKDDLANLDKHRQMFRSELEYDKIMFEDKELILSLAIGVSVHKPGEKYGETFQRADDEMYANKKEVKEKYHISGR